MKRPRYRIERNAAVGHPPHQEWVVWLVDEFGDEWAMGFTHTRARARWLAKSKAMQTYLREALEEANT